MHKGQHLLIDCHDVPRDVCLDDRRWLESMAEGARRAGSTVISQIRYQFGQDSPAGCTAIVMLDESHVSVHTYAELGLVAMDCFTCGSTNPMDIWTYVKSAMGLNDADIREVERFPMEARRHIA